jgi:competence protein ComEC
LDVGQGDCTIAVDPDSGGALVIDCPTGGSGLAIKALTDLGVMEIDLAVITHSDIDHLGGMYEVISTIPTRELRYNRDTLMPADGTEAIKLRAALRGFFGLHETMQLQREAAVSGNAGQVGGIAWQVLSPTTALLDLAQANSDRNLASVVLRLEADGLRVLVAGDADSRAWKRLLNAGHDVTADVFLVPHHGGSFRRGRARASFGEVIDAVGASHHVVSVGTPNQYRHPALSTLTVLRQKPGRIMCTQVNERCLGAAALPKAEAAALPAHAQGGVGENPNACQCAGSVRVATATTGFDVSPSIPEHAVVISKLGTPRCLPQAPT